MNGFKYNIVMFVYNEQDNIEILIISVFNSINEFLYCFYVIVNGCIDNIVSVVNEVK